MGESKQVEPKKPKLEVPPPPGLPFGPLSKPRVDSPTAEASQIEKGEPQCFEFLVFKEVRRYLSAREITAFEKLVLPYLKSKPNPQKSPYIPPEERRKDLNTLKKAQEKGRSEPLEKKINYIRAKIFEALLSTLMELYWMPNEVFITETSELDDWLNGADAVLETKSLLVIIDFTSQRDQEALHRKIGKIFNRIDSGNLGQLRYFESQFARRMLPPLRMIPSVIVGLSQANIETLLDLYFRKDTKAIQNHWVKYAIAEEILKQIEFFKRYINNPHRKNYKADVAQRMSAAYDDLGKSIQRLITLNPPQEEKEMTAVRGRPDTVYQLIMQAVI